MNDLKNTLTQLHKTRNADDLQLLQFLATDACEDELFALSDTVRRQVYGTEVYVRGLIEFSNYCKNNCYYCGIRADNHALTRYRLSPEEILACCESGYSLGIRTFVLQSGEDSYYSDKLLFDIISAIHTRYPDCAITLSVGERTKAGYQAFFDAGARRYLLRHEAACPQLYSKLHPKNMSLANRIQCLFDLKEIGYQVGAGFMVGAPYQTPESLLADIRFLQELDPDMIGIGPYIHHPQTPFSDFENGKLRLTLRLIAALRLMFPHALIPATTALASVAEDGREKGILAGANVIMPNISPQSVRSLYNIYENKICTVEKPIRCSELLPDSISQLGYHTVTDIGDVKRIL